MPITTGQYVDRESTRIQEVISKSLEYQLSKLDPVFDNMISTSIGVGKADDIGRDWKIIKNFTGGFTGVVETGWGKNTYQDDRALFGTSTQAYGAKLFTQTAGQVFPDATEGAKNATYQLGIPLKGLVLNIGFTLDEMGAEANKNVIGSIIAPRLKAFARHIAWIRANLWYINQSTSYMLGIVNLATATYDDTNNKFKATVTNYAVQRFHVGMRVDLYNVSGGAPGSTRYNESGGTRLPVFVSNVDGLTGQVEFQFDPSATLTITQAGIFGGASEAAVVFANSRSGTSPNFTMMAGINSWLKPGDSSGATATNSNTLLGTDSYDSSKTINVNVHNEYKSLSASSVGVLTENKLKQYLARWFAAKDPLGQTMDTLVASEGIWLNYESQKAGMYVIDRTGRLSDLNREGQNEGFTITYEGRTLKAHTSAMVESGALYGFKKGGNNFKNYVPPSPSGAKRGGEGVDTPGIPFEFVVPALTGSSSVKWPVLSNSNLTNMVQMPGWLRMQTVADQPAGMILTGITEDRWYQS